MAACASCGNTYSKDLLKICEGCHDYICDVCEENHFCEEEDEYFNEEEED